MGSEAIADRLVRPPPFMFGNFRWGVKGDTAETLSTLGRGYLDAGDRRREDGVEVIGPG